MVEGPRGATTPPLLEGRFPCSGASAQAFFRAGRCPGHTGWGKLYGKDNARFVKSCPGIGVKAAEWLISQNPVLLGSDNWPVEVAPNPDSQISLPVHQVALVVNGVHLLENLKLDELVSKNVQEFALIMTPLKIRGATGSTVSPIAVR